MPVSPPLIAKSLPPPVAPLTIGIYGLEPETPACTSSAATAVDAAEAPISEVRPDRSASAVAPTPLGAEAPRPSPPPGPASTPGRC